METGDNPAFESHLRRFFLDMAAVKADEDRNEHDAGAFVFHMVECIGDMKALCALSDELSAVNDAEAKRILQGVVYHALPHLIAAARMYDYAPDFL